MGFDAGSLFGGGLLGESSGISTHGIFGSKPKVAKYVPPPTPTKEAATAVEGNIGNYPGISKLEDLYTADELNRLKSIMPGILDNYSATGAAADSLFATGIPLTQGDLPPEFEAAIRRQAAQAAVSGGYAGSPMDQFGQLRSYGKGIFDAYNQGAALVGQATNITQARDALARRSMLDPTRFFISPQEQLTYDTTNALLKQAGKQNAYNVRAAPDPTQSGVYNSVMQVLGEVLSIYGGGGGWKNIGGAQGGAAPPIGASGSYEGQYGGMPVYRATPVFNTNYVDTSYNYGGVT